jgi:hypothetical protein
MMPAAMNNQPIIITGIGDFISFLHVHNVKIKYH